jgi:hypothetical protein
VKICAVLANDHQPTTFLGGIVPNHTLNGVPEWAYGVVDWLELGAYAPVYSWTGDGRVLIDGAKLRAEFVVPHAAERNFFYGINFELSFKGGSHGDCRGRRTITG